MTKLKVGDRVAVYEAGGRYIGTIYGKDGNLVEVNMRYENTDNVMMFVHFKQCRKLKSKTRG